MLAVLITSIQEIDMGVIIGLNSLQTSNQISV